MAHKIQMQTVMAMTTTATAMATATATGDGDSDGDGKDDGDGDGKGDSDGNGGAMLANELVCIHSTQEFLGCSWRISPYGIHNRFSNSLGVLSVWE